MKNKKILLIILAVIILAGSMVGLNASAKNGKKVAKNTDKIQVTSSNFASYDFLRAIIGENQNVDLTFLLGAGKDSHSYDPTAQDLITIQNSDLFVYIGGEMESWSDKVLESLDNKDMKVMCIADDVETIEEQEVDGAEEHEHEHEEISEQDIKDRTLSEFNGKWKSLYPLLVGGELDEYCEHKAEEDEDTSATKETYLEKYKKSWNCDVNNILIDNDKITFTAQDGKNVSATYTYAGYSVKKDEDGDISSVRYQFQTDNENAPKYVQFNDHGHEPGEVEHFHIYFGNESFERLMDSETNPYFMPDELSNKEILEELMGHEHSHEEGAFDEHIWTSPKNAIAMVNSLEKAMEELDPQNAGTYKKNAENYIAQIKEVDSQIQEIVDNQTRDRLVFGDKMPMQYFIDYYNLEVSAAFSGCSTETEPSSKTIAYLVNKAKEENIPVILYIEMNTGKVAETIAKEVGNNCKPMQIQTLHNITKDDFDAGETWVSLMKRNLDVLKTALQ